MSSMFSKQNYGLWLKVLIGFTVLLPLLIIGIYLHSSGHIPTESSINKNYGSLKQVMADEHKLSRSGGKQENSGCDYAKLESTVNHLFSGADSADTAFKQWQSAPVPESLKLHTFDNKPIDQSVRRLMHELVVEEDIPELIKLIKFGGTPATAVLELMYQIHGKLDEQFLYELAYLPINLNVSNVVSLLKIGMPETVLLQLVEISDTDWNVFWFDGTQFTTLPYLAVQYGKMELTYYWLAQGVPMYVQGKIKNIYSYIKKNVHELKHNNIAIVLDHLANNQGIEPSLVDLTSLQVWLAEPNVSDNLVNTIQQILDKYLTPNAQEIVHLLQSQHQCLQDLYKLNTASSERDTHLPVSFQQLNTHLQIYIDSQFVPEIKLEDQETDPFIEQNYKALNLVLVALEDQNIDLAFEIVETDFESDSDRQLAGNVIAEIAVYRKYSAEQINKVKSYGGMLDSAVASQLLVLADVDMLRAAELFGLDWLRELGGIVLLEPSVDLPVIDFFQSRGLEVKQLPEVPNNKLGLN